MIHYELDESTGRALVTMTGDIGDEEAIVWFEGFLEALRGRKSIAGVVDTRGLERLDVWSEAVSLISQLAEDNEAVFAGTRWAIVAPGDAVYGMARMYAILRDRADYEIAVFRSMEEAMRWMEQGS